MLNSTISSFGLDISELSLKIVQLKKVNKGLYLQAWNNLSLPENAIVNGDIANEKKFIEILVKLIKKPTGRITTPYVVLCLPETKTFIKLVSVDYSQKNMEAALADELARHIPVKLSELNYDWQLLSNNEEKKQADVLVAAAPIKLIDSYTQAVKKVGLKPIALEVEAQSIVNSLFAYQTMQQVKKGLKIKSLNFFNKKKKITENKVAPKKIDKKITDKSYGKIIIDLGASRSSLILYNHNIIQFTSSLEISGQKITQIIADKLKLDFNEAEKAKLLCGLDQNKGKGKLKETIGSSFKELVDEIGRMTKFYDVHFNQSSPINQILLTGGGANLIGLADFLARESKVEVIKGYPLKDYLINNKDKPIHEKEMLTFNTAVGLALRNILINN